MAYLEVHFVSRPEERGNLNNFQSGHRLHCSRFG